MKIQKEFKITPLYIELNHDVDLGYKMGVYICIGQPVHDLNHNDSMDYDIFKSFKKIKQSKIFLDPNYFLANVAMNKY